MLPDVSLFLHQQNKNYTQHKDQINQLRRENLEIESTDSIIETKYCAHLCHPIACIICESRYVTL